VGPAGGCKSKFVGIDLGQWQQSVAVQGNNIKESYSQQLEALRPLEEELVVAQEPGNPNQVRYSDDVPADINNINGLRVVS